tara:strand:- start:1147 stop:1641 length:495 start_codon:yes stop_codon:yes gene_type:complete
MKFMFFNLMAVIAILYLVAVDGQPIKPIADLLPAVASGDATDKGRELAERARQKLESFKANWEKFEIAEEAPKNQAEKKPEIQPVDVAMRPVNKVPLLSEHVSKPAPTQKIVAAKPESPELIAPMARKKPELPEQKFMSRAERRRELNRLAHDMEMMFADKLSE